MHNVRSCLCRRFIGQKEGLKYNSGPSQGWHDDEEIRIGQVYKNSAGGVQLRLYFKNEKKSTAFAEHFGEHP